VELRPEHYLLAAQERLSEAVALRRGARWVLAMYVAGLSAECMMRAFIPRDSEFDARHDLGALLGASEWPLGSSERRRLHTAVSGIRVLWNNSLRYADEARVRSHLKRIGLDRGPGIQRGADALKVRCAELESHASVVVRIGSATWKP